MKNKDHQPQYFTKLEDLYKLRMGSFMQTANMHIFNKDYAMDAIHDAFAKAQVYHNKNPERNFREQIMHVLIIRSCRKYNKKYSQEVSFDRINEFLTEIQ